MEQISRSEQKRQLKQVEMAARELAELNDAELKRLTIGADLCEALMLCRTTKGGALKRQIKFAAKLLRNEDFDAILLYLRRKRGSKLEAERFFHDAERWRDRIVSDALEALTAHRREQQPWPVDWRSEAVDQVVTHYPDLDEHDLRQAVHHYARSRNKVYYREVFRMIRAAAEKKRQNDIAQNGAHQIDHQF